MRIIHLIGDLNLGGMQKFCLDLSSHQSERNHKVEIWCINSSDSFHPNKNIAVKNFSSSQNFLNIRLMTKILFKLSSLPLDTKVHTHGIALYYSSLAIIFLRKLRFFHTIHNLCTHEAGRVRRSINRFFYRLGLVMPVTISDEVHSSFFENYTNCSCKLIKNGVPSFPALKESDIKVELLANYNLDIDECPENFVSVGRFDYQKNRKLLFDVFELYSRNNRSKLFIVGGDLDPENKFYQEVKDHPGVKRGSIVLLGDRTDVSNIYAISKYFILSSRFEGLPLSLLEAMRDGLVCISTPAGGCGSVLKNIGFVSDNFEFQGLYNAIIQAVNSDSAKISEKTISYFHQNFTMDICSEKYESLYSQGDLK